VLDAITPIVLTLNEAPNIARTLSALRWAKRVVLLDSHSSDDTLAIAATFSNTLILQRRFDSHAAQWNHALRSDAIETEWVLTLDADYLVPEAFAAELAQLEPSPDIAGYEARFHYCIDGEPLRGSLYPPVTVLFRRAQAHFEQDGHTQRIRVTGGRVAKLNAELLHDDRKSFAHWLGAQERYAAAEAEKLRHSKLDELSWADRVRKVPFLAPPLVGLHCLVMKGCALDGRRGFTYAGQRALAELILSLKLLQRRSP
jgi:glycosyltransferase involved in cell wall biosynthesis